MGAVRLEGIEKVFEDGGVAAAGVDLEVADRELLVLVGPSGCGKSTLLRIVAGLEAPTRGRVLIGGEDVTGRPPQRRDVAMVFQTYALYPHKTVRENLAFGLRMRGADAAAIRERVAEVAEALGIAPLLDRRPAQLSGGQRQRVALGRALARRARVFLLDEPLSNLDARLRVRTRAEIARLHQRIDSAMIYVTHDQEEAMTLGDRIAVLRDGRVEQVGRPIDLYERPATAFVAGFIGSPPMNLIEGSLSVDGARFEGRGIALSLEGRPAGPGSEAGRGAPDAAGGAGARGVLLGVRPEDVRIVPPEGADAVAEAEVVEPLGREVLVHAALVTGGEGAARAERDPPRVTAIVRPAAAPSRGERLGLHLERDRLHLFDRRSGERLA